MTKVSTSFRYPSPARIWYSSELLDFAYFLYTVTLDAAAINVQMDLITTAPKQFGSFVVLY